jgi:hypothetical protein
VCLGLATLPTISPVADKELETEGVDLHTWLETNAQISEVHLVLFGVGEKEGEVASNSEEKVIVEWREIGELINEHLGNTFSARAFSSDAVLCSLGKEFVGKLTQPGLEHGADDVDIVEVVLLEEIDVKFYVTLAKENNPISGSAHLRQISSATS